MDSGMLDQIRRCIDAEQQRLAYLKALAEPGEEWLSLTEDIARIERQINRQRAKCSDPEGGH